MSLSPKEEPKTKRDGRKRSHLQAQPSLAEEARDYILEDIIQCRLRPGEMIQLSPLADKYGMSKTPIREALTLLQREGLIESIPYKGYLVRPIDLDEVHEIYFMRQLLEGAAAELAAQRITEEEIEQLTNLRAPQTMVMTLEYDNYCRTFHLIIAKASRLSRLAETVMRTYNDMRRLQYAGIGRPRPEAITAEHEEILAALETRDPKRARKAMVEHISNIRQRALEV
jgi:DNA-binding GntR family transcriptional regulator